ncbi:MAG: SH3 domain-containing protein [Candidatus Eremiobacterota bacterium]
MSTLLLPTEEGEVVDAPRVKPWIIVAGVLAVLLLLLLVITPSKKKPSEPAMATPAAAGTPPPVAPVATDPLDFAVPAKPPLIQRAPQAAPTGQPGGPGPGPSTPAEDFTQWSEKDGLPVYSQHGLNRPVINRLKKGERVLWIEDYQNWSHVTMLDHRDGWVISAELTNTRPEYALDPNPGEAAETLTGFYRDINQKNFARAYDRLIPDWKAELNYQDFEKGYEKVREITCKVEKTEVISPIEVRCDVVLDCDEDPRPRQFKGTYTLEYRPIFWHLSTGILEEQEGGPAPMMPGL